MPWHKCHKCKAQRAAAPIHRVHKKYGVFSSKSATFCYFIALWVALGGILRAEQHPKAAEGALAVIRTQHSHHESTLFYPAWWNCDPQTYPRNSTDPRAMSLLTKDISLKGELLSNRLESWTFTAQFCHRLQGYDYQAQLKPSVSEQSMKRALLFLCSRYPVCTMGQWTLSHLRNPWECLQTAGRAQHGCLAQTDEHVLLEKWK